MPIFELHEHVTRYGPVIAALPLLLSRLQFTLTMSHATPSRPPAAVHADPASQNQAPNFGGHGGAVLDVTQHAQVMPHGMHAPAEQYGGNEGYGMM